MTATVDAPALSPPAITVDTAAGTVAGMVAAELVERFGSPLFVYDLDAVAGRARALVRALPPAFDIAYALKANPSLALVAHLAGAGLGADVASGGELETALLAGVPASRIVFTGPGKTDGELARALDAGVRAITRSHWRRSSGSSRLGHRGPVSSPRACSSAARPRTPASRRRSWAASARTSSG